MQTQFDHKVRTVGLNNLEAMCKRISGVCHRFTISKVTANRVYVEYSNPDEYGNPNPITAQLPAYPQHNNTAVVLDAIRFTGGQDYDEQAFDQLWDCEQLYRTFEETREVWKTEYEILSPKYPAWNVTSRWDKGGCIQTWICNGSEFKDWRTAQAFAVTAMKDLEKQAGHASNGEQFFEPVS